jgi:hypothetical protein
LELTFFDSKYFKNLSRSNHTRKKKRGRNKEEKKERKKVNKRWRGSTLKKIGLILNLFKFSRSWET